MVQSPRCWSIMHKKPKNARCCTERVEEGVLGRCREDGREGNEQAIWRMLFTRRRDFPPRAMARGERMLAGRRRGRKVVVEVCGSALASSKSGVDLPISDKRSCPAASLPRSTTYSSFFGRYCSDRSKVCDLIRANLGDASMQTL